jgi:hypothetical protein
MAEGNQDALRFDARRWTRIAIVLYTVLVAFVTLSPGDASEGTRLGLHCVMCGDLWLRDVLLNVLLFVPLGWLGARTGGSLRRVTTAAALLSFSIELAQLLAPSLGRFPILGDLLANTIGALAGAGVPRLWLRYYTRSSKRSRVILAGIWMVALTVGSWWLVQPALPGDADWYAVATADLGHLARFPGTVQAGRINGLEVPFRLSSAAVLSPSADGATLEIEASVRVTSRGDGLAPVVSIFDGRQREVVLLGIEGGSWVLRARTNAGAIGLFSPHLRLQSEPGRLRDSLPWHGRIVARVAPDGWCITLPSGGARCRRRWPHQVGSGVLAGRFPSRWQPEAEVLAMVCWYGVLVAPLLLARWRSRRR